MRLIYNPTEKKNMKQNFQNNLILKDEIEKKIIKRRKGLSC